MQQQGDLLQQNPQNQTAPNRKLLIPAILVVLLVLFNLAQWAWYRADSKSSALKIDEKQQAYTELMASFKANKAIVDSLKARFPNDADLFAAFDRELAEKEAAIRGKIAAEDDLSAARREIAQLNQMRAEFVDEIGELKQKMGVLVSEKTTLIQERDRAIVERNQYAATAQQSSIQLEKEQVNGSELALEREKLRREKEEIDAKMEANAWLPVSNISIKAVETTKKGKESEVTKAKYAQRIRIDFSTGTNGLVTAGKQVFKIQIIAPGGTTFYLESQGSGQDVDKKDGSVFKFSTIAACDYSPNAAENHASASWSQPEGQSFEKGEYQVFIFHKGQKVGAGKLVLK